MIVADASFDGPGGSIGESHVFWNAWRERFVGCMGRRRDAAGARFGSRRLFGSVNADGWTT